MMGIAVEHRFFPGGLCRVADFVPTQKTCSAMKKAGLLIKDMPNGIRAFYDEDKLDSLMLYVADPDEPLFLGFKVFSKDACFMNYTHPPTYSEDSILCFDNLNAKNEAAGDIMLHDEEYVSEADFRKLDLFPFNLLNARDKLIRPAFVVNIRIGMQEGGPADKRGAPAFRNYTIRFRARETFWKYYLLGDMTKRKSYIYDRNNGTGFELIGEETLSDNRTAVIFRSTEAIPLREKSECHFQLKEQGAGGGKVLIKRLPVASACHIFREVINGKEAAVSEMYINC